MEPIPCRSAIHQVLDQEYTANYPDKREGSRGTKLLQDSENMCPKGREIIGRKQDVGRIWMRIVEYFKIGNNQLAVCWVDSSISPELERLDHPRDERLHVPRDYRLRVGNQFPTFNVEAVFVRRNLNNYDDFGSSRGVD